MAINRKLIDEMGTAFYTSRSSADFTSFYNYFKPMIKNYVYKNYHVLHPKHEEIASSFFTAVFRFIDQYNPELPFSAWISGILRNECRILLRDPKRPNSKIELTSGKHPIHDENWGSGLEGENNVELWIENEYQKFFTPILYQAIESLEPMYKELIEDKYMKDLSLEEIALKNNWNLNTTKTRLRKAIVDIRIKLNPNEKLKKLKKRSRHRSRKDTSRSRSGYKKIGSATKRVERIEGGFQD